MDLSGDDLRAAVKRFEDVMQFGRGDAVSVVVNAEADFLAARSQLMATDREADPAFETAIFDRVANEVLQAGANGREVAEHRGQVRRNLLFERATFLVDLVADVFSNVGNDIGYRE